MKMGIAGAGAMERVTKVLKPDAPLASHSLRTYTFRLAVAEKDKLQSMDLSKKE